MNHLRNLVLEIHRRSLWQVLSIYLVGSWIAYSVVWGLTEGLALPLWVPGLAVALLVLGLPIVLATACVRERPAASSLHGLPKDQEQVRSDGEAGASPGTSATPGGLPSPSRRALLTPLALVCLLALAVAAWLFFSRTPATEELGQADAGIAGVPEDARYASSIAVLPFQALGPQTDAFLGHGIAEDITSFLAQVSGLKVISRTSVVALEGENLTLPQLADSLGVDHVMEGTIELMGGEYRVNAQLIQGRTDAHLWAGTYSAPLEALMGLRERLARDAMMALVEGVPDLRSPGLRSRTNEPAAHEAYSRGRNSLHSRARTSLLEAMREFERAIALDPTYAPAYAGLSAAHGLWLSYGYAGEITDYQAAANSIALANMAITLDINCAEAYSARGYVMTKVWAPTELVRPDFDRALDLLPGAPDVHGWQGHLLSREGKLAMAMEESQKAIDLDPVAPGRRTGFALEALAAREWDLAIREARTAVSLEPRLLWPRQILGLALLLSGRATECLASDLLDALPALRAMCLFEVGRVGEARAAADSLGILLQDPKRLGPDFAPARMLQDLTSYHAWIGEIPAATRWLEASFARSPIGLDHRLLVSGLFDKALADDGFSSRLAQLQERAWGRVFRESQVAR